MGSLLSLLVTVVILGLICYVVFWALGKLALPEPFGKVVMAIVVLIIVIYLIGLLVGSAPMVKLNF